MPVLVLIPARGGSKGLPRKNLRDAGGLSLTARAVLVARRFAAAERLDGAAVVVDTDDSAIADEGLRYGADVPFLREPDLARDNTATHVSVLRCVERLAEAGREFDVVVLLQPTSPLRTVEDVSECWHAFDHAAAPSVVAVSPQSHPIELAVRVDERARLDWVAQPGGAAQRRQDFVPAFRITGGVYVASVRALRERNAFVIPGLSRAVVLPAEHGLDVDTASDLAVADALLRSGAAARAPASVGGRLIGCGAPAYVIAEAGVNHNGDPALAHRLVDAAADAGADAVKFQTFDADRLASPGAEQATYQTLNTGVREDQRQMLRRLVLPRDAYPGLKAHAEARNLAFLSSPFDEDSADFLEALGVPAFKIPSGEINNIRFLAHVARKGRPMLVSTGMSTLAEVAEAVLTIEAHGNPPLALFHCVTNYPASPEECNLSAMATMRAAFGLSVGWSDHTEGIDVSIAAVALGADILEKHFTLDRALPGPDHKASLEPTELARMIAALRRLESARGSGQKMPAAVEQGFASVVRKSLHCVRALPAGHILRADDIVALRPADGLAPTALPRVVGRRLRRALPAGALLDEHDLG